MTFNERKEKLYNRFGLEDNISEDAALKVFRINYLANIDSKYVSGLKKSFVYKMFIYWVARFFDLKRRVHSPKFYLLH